MYKFFIQSLTLLRCGTLLGIITAREMVANMGMKRGSLQLT